MKKTITEKDLKRGLNILAESKYEHNPPFYVDNYNYYRSEVAKGMGFHCLIRELKEAKKKENGFIKMAMGFDLYLNKKLPTNKLSK